MKRTFRKSVAPFLLLFLLLATMISPVSASEGSTVNYVALGDSLAAGQTPDKKVDKSYSDFIAAKFEEGKILESFSKEFSVPGYTTQQVLDGLKEEKVQEAVKAANLITISAGANDLLRLIERNPDTQQFAFDPTKVQPTLLGIQQNLTDILNQIKELSPEAKVLVMGYYFPFPHLPEEQKPQLVQMTKFLNDTIEGTTVLSGATFVPVSEKFGTDAKELLPNPLDVHPTIAGYELMAEAFFEVYLTLDQPKEFKDVPETHWAYQEISLLANAGAITDVYGDYFEPEKALTRGEAAAFLFNMMNVTMSVPENPGFKDVPENHPLYYPIAKLTEVGVFSKAEYFNPGDTLTRVQMAKVIALAFDIKNNSKYQASDLSKDYWANEHIAALVSNGILKGFPDGTFRPYDPTTRAQFAAVLTRAIIVQNGEWVY